MFKRSGSIDQSNLAIADFVAAIQHWPLWVRLAWNDILLRYRRSALGPFWFMASTAITVVAIGIVYSQIFNLPTREPMPYIGIGLIVWNFMNSIMLDAGDLFSGSESFIKQIRLPHLLYTCRFVLSKIIIFAHDFPIYVALLLYFRLWPGAIALYAIPGFFILAVNGALVSTTIGMISARFRDIPRIIASLCQIMFLMTPIIWTPNLLGSHVYLAQGNPFFHLIEIVRAPLLGILPSAETVAAVFLITAINLLVTTFIFIRYRCRIAYWI